MTGELMRHNIYNTLRFFKQYGSNRFGTRKVSELEVLLHEKESEYRSLFSIKSDIDRRALRRVNSFIALGAFIMLGQFFYITTGTYVLFCWDVMEPQSYLMMTANLVAAFGYYAFRGRELSQDELQLNWFQRTARKLYDAEGFDLENYETLERDILELRDIIHNSV